MHRVAEAPAVRMEQPAAAEEGLQPFAHAGAELVGVDTYPHHYFDRRVERRLDGDLVPGAPIELEVFDNARPQAVVENAATREVDGDEDRAPRAGAQRLGIGALHEW